MKMNCDYYFVHDQPQPWSAAAQQELRDLLDLRRGTDGLAYLSLCRLPLLRRR
jgi:hypothetical protein